MRKTLRLAPLAMLLLGVLSCSTNELLNGTDENSNLDKSANPSSAKYTSEYSYLGSGYDVTKSYAVESSTGNQVIDVYQLVNDIEDQQISTQDYKENYGENAYEYAKNVTTKLDLGGTFSLFKQSITAAFNGSLTNNYKFDGKYIYGSYHLLIKQKRYKFKTPTSNNLKNYLTPQFTQALQTMTPQEIVQYYGTHVLTDIYIGGKLDVMFRSETSNENRKNASEVGVKVTALNIFNINVNNNTDTSSASKNFNKTLHYKSYGGDATKSLLGTINLDQSNQAVNIANWQNSCTPQNSVFVDIAEHGVIKLYDLVDDPAKKAVLKAYIDQYLVDNQVQMEFVPIDIHRYYNGSTTDHYYTKSTGAFSGYGYEGVAFRAYNYKAPNTVAIYRYWNGTEHYYATAPGAPAGYVPEGIEFYAYPSQVNGSTPVYQYFGRKRGDHFYTTSFQAYPNYNYEGIAFYAL